MIGSLIDMVPSGIVQGLIIGLVALGITIPFRLLSLADLTADGSYTFGAVSGAVALSHGLHPVVALCIGAIAGGVLGMGTGMLYVFLKLDVLLSGIILSTMVYSLNLRMMGRPNIPLFDAITLFDNLDVTRKIILLIFIAMVITAAILWILKTEVGLALRAVGYNPRFASRYGIDNNKYIIGGFGSGNFLSGLAGALMVQTQKYVDIGMGMGIVIHAIAALLLGEFIIRGRFGIFGKLLAPLLGALLYQQLQGVALVAGCPPSDIKFITGALVLLMFVLGRRSSKVGHNS